MLRLLALFTLLLSQQLDRGTLTLYVRDAASRPVAGVHITLWEDLDVDGRTRIAQAVTDSMGATTFHDLRYSTYAVEFEGMINGAAVQPLADQNQGPLNDTAGVLGFGIRLAEARLTRLFVLTSGAGQIVPLFDQAQSTNQPVQPLIVPKIAIPETPEAPPTTVARIGAQVTAKPIITPTPETDVSRTSPQKQRAWMWLPFGLSIIGGGLLWIDYRARKRRNAEDERDGVSHEN